MAQTALQQLQELIIRMNGYRDSYYNKNVSEVSDEVYDRLLDEVVRLETETCVYYANSPTQGVGYPPVSKLEKAVHERPLLSLEKIKDIPSLISFMGRKQIMLMLKLDGLTVKLTYEDGILIEAATRGDGNTGEIVTHNASGISGIPAGIPVQGRLVITGEAFIRPSDFEELKETLVDSKGEKYKNGRNLASGSVRLHKGLECGKRKVTFMPFAVLEGFPDLKTKAAKLRKLPELGFTPCKFLLTNRPLSQSEMDGAIQQLRAYAKDNDIPIDGIVLTYNDIAFSESCGRTGHHYKDGVAFKFENEAYETVLQEIEWNTSRSGEIAPVAIFKPVVIDGCDVGRATLHNVSYIEKLELSPGCRILVTKRNEIIPKVEENLDRGRFTLSDVIPSVCPCCGAPTRIHGSRADKEGERGTRRLYCDNWDCTMRKIKKFVHFAGQKAMNIEGMSEGIIETFVGKGWLHTVLDIYSLDQHREEIIALEGWGEKSWKNLCEAIQRSRNTTFERYLIAMDIPMIGTNASRTIGEFFSYSLEQFTDAIDNMFDFTFLPDIGDILHNNIHEWFFDEENRYIWDNLQKLVKVKKPTASQKARESSPFAGLTIVVTGRVEPYTREGIHEVIRSLGAKAGSSVTSKTNYLICGDKAGSKLEKAYSLGVKVLSPTEFFEMANAA